MYMCMYIYIYIYVQTYIHIHTYVHIQRLPTAYFPAAMNEVLALLASPSRKTWNPSAVSAHQIQSKAISNRGFS